jgi:hypothetical protein
VRRPIFRPTISFNFHDLSRDALAVWTRHNEEFAEQISRDGEDIGAQIKLTWQVHSV